MMLNMDKWGAYLLFSLFTFVGVGRCPFPPLRSSVGKLILVSAVWVFFFFPETKGRSIESMDMLFAYSTTSMRKYAYPTEDEKVLVQDEESAFRGPDGGSDSQKEIHVTQHEDVVKR